MSDWEYRIKPVPHKWQKEMDAWKEGKKIEYRQCRCAPDAPIEPANRPSFGWSDMSFIPKEHQWNAWWLEFRIKPDEEVCHIKASLDNGLVVILSTTGQYPSDNLRLTFVDGKLVKAEIL